MIETSRKPWPILDTLQFMKCWLTVMLVIFPNQNEDGFFVIQGVLNPKRLMSDSYQHCETFDANFLGVTPSTRILSTTIRLLV